METAITLHSGQLPAECQNPNATALRCGASTLHACWDGEGRMTALGGIVYFAEYLREAGFLDRLLCGSPLRYTSPNAPAPADVLGTFLVAVLAGLVRYEAINILRGDAVCPEALGFRRIVSEDSVRRALQQAAVREAAWNAWLDAIQDRILGPLLTLEYVLDLDNTVKCLYGHQEGAEKGYNPKKPGRPSHNYQTFVVGRLRLILGVRVLPGKQHAGRHGAEAAFAFLRRLPRKLWPRFLRGDVSYGTSPIMDEAEAVNLHYLFKLARTKRLKRLFGKLCAHGEWHDAGQGWQGCFQTLKLAGWSHTRRCLFLRRPAPARDAPAAPAARADQLLLPTFADELLPPDPDWRPWDFCVLVTDMADLDATALSQLYRDRGDCENVFDELKNQWGWCGFTTRDLARNRIVARFTAAVYNLWSLYTLLASPDTHREAKTSRPLLLHILGRVAHSARQTTVHLVSTHALADAVAAVLTHIHGLLAQLKASAEQLGSDGVWTLLLALAVRRYWRNSGVDPPSGLPGQLTFAFD
jgi:hypothetical protein